MKTFDRKAIVVELIATKRTRVVLGGRGYFISPLPKDRNDELTKGIEEITQQLDQTKDPVLPRLSMQIGFLKLLLDHFPEFREDRWKIENEATFEELNEAFLKVNACMFYTASGGEPPKDGRFLFFG